MANGDKEKDGHGMCMGCGTGGHHWSHMLIRVLILLFVFWAGIEFGELRALVRMDSSMMGGWGTVQQVHRMDMMGGGYGAVPDTTTSPATAPTAPAAQ